MEALVALSEGDRGVRRNGFGESVTEFLDVIDDDVPWRLREWPRSPGFKSTPFNVCREPRSWRPHSLARTCLRVSQEQVAGAAVAQLNTRAATVSSGAQDPLAGGV